MELRHLAAFVAVAEERSFTAAAARLVLVQSAVSASVASLEREVGARLLDRTPRRVELTDAGAALLPHARTALDAARDAREAVTAVRGGLRGTVRVGTLTSVPLLDVPGLLGEFHRRHPDVALRLTAAPSGSRGLVAEVAARRLDLAFVSAPGPLPAGVRLTELASAPMVLVLPRGHALAGGDAGPVDVRRLDGLDFIDSPEGYGNRAVADAALAGAGVGRRVTIEIADIGTAAAYVRHGLGVALLPRFAVGASDGVVTREVGGADLRWPLSLATPADRRPGAAAAALARLVREGAATAG
ncbi:MAG: LysR family transcriptional regulator [Micrococcales bacterium]|uniref:LysR family transcriptional regulator n=1 Tax=Cellulomonas sp. P4 TaxID=3142533 RepID=UPI0019A059A6|nr:LysR family transcriptional regulator [Micrococcales bacterium]